MADLTASLPYHEPGIVVILIQTSFLLLLNLVNAVLNRLVYCGLLGQVLIGIAWGSPGAKWLSVHVQEVVVQLGYLGLILLVYEGYIFLVFFTSCFSCTARAIPLTSLGGLSTSFASLKANLLLSIGVALTGIVIPIALSYVLQGLVGATALQAFAAGAALCSTSLGTTFTVLSSSGLSSTRLGVVLSSAAMMDDVVGLVMVQVISNLGGGNIDPITVVRPVLVSLAFALLVPVICYFVVRRLTVFLNSQREANPSGKLQSVLCRRQTPLVIHTLLLVGLVTGASYAGTSNLFAAYIAGAVVSWWDSEVPHPTVQHQEQSGSDIVQKDKSERSGMTTETTSKTKGQPESSSEQASHVSSTTGSAIYEYYYHQAVMRILQPFFFASIGFSIPISRMFSGSILWRGMVYTTLMMIGKLVCGFWLVRLPLTSVGDKFRSNAVKLKFHVPHLWGRRLQTKQPNTGNAQVGADGATEPSRPESRGVSGSSVSNSPSLRAPSFPAKPLSLHPPLILALAMTARGEIGFLISAVAESRGVFSSGEDGSDADSDIFLVVTWAIVLCTMIGPLGVGLLVRRVKKLSEKKENETGGTGRDVLGVWGVE